MERRGIIGWVILTTALLTTGIGGYFLLSPRKLERPSTIDTNSYQITTSGTGVFKQQDGKQKLVALIGYIYSIDDNKLKLFYGEGKRAVSVGNKDVIKLITIQGEEKDINLSDLKIGDFITVNLGENGKTIIKQTN